LTITQLREPMIASGLVTSADIDHMIALCDDPAFTSAFQLNLGHPTFISAY
jgi:hypothetical protein